MWKRFIVALILLVALFTLGNTHIIKASNLIIASMGVVLLIMGLTWRENATIFTSKEKITTNPYLHRIVAIAILIGVILITPIVVRDTETFWYFRLSLFASLSMVVFALGNTFQGWLINNVIKVEDRSLAKVGRIEIWLFLVGVILSLFAFLYYLIFQEFSIPQAVVIATSCLLVQSVDVITIGSNLIARIGLMMSNNKGILLSKARNFERSGDVTDIVFSKRGVITYGELTIGTIAAAQPGKIIKIAASLEQGVSHPIAQVISQKMLELDQPKVTVKRQEYYPGKGVYGIVDSQEYIFGNLDLMHDFDIALGMLQREKLRLEGEGETVLILARTGGRALGSHNRRTPGEVMGLVSIVDKLRPEVRTVFARLAKMGLQAWVLSGDSQVSVEALGLQSGAVKKRLIGEVSGLKQSQAVALIAKKARGLVALVGDGDGDGVALETAPFSIAFGKDMTGGNSKRDVFIKGGRLDALLDLFSISRKVISLSNNKNIFYLVINILFILLVVARLVSPYLTPVISVSIPLTAFAGYYLIYRYTGLFK